MAGLSNYFETAILNYLFRGSAAPSIPATLYIGLFTADPVDTGTANEVSGNNYSRVSISTSNAFGAPSGTPAQSIANSSTITFPVASGSWGTITHFAIFDAASNGNMLVGGALNTPQAIGLNTAAQFGVGSLTISLD
jgi:hypothetical protein